MSEDAAKIAECALCLIAWNIEDMVEAVIAFAYDTNSSGTKRWTCKNRDTCNARRHQRFLAQLAYTASKA